MTRQRLPAVHNGEIESVANIVPRPDTPGAVRPGPVEHLHDNTSTRNTVATRPVGAESLRHSDILDLLGYTTGTHQVRNTLRTINSLQRTKPSKCGASIDFRR